MPPEPQDPPESSPAALRTLDGRYRLQEQVGQGGMSVVYRAFDLALEREVAVKVLHPHLAEQPAARARLQREAQAVAKLRHEDILQIFDSAGGSAAACYLVTEFIHGPTLRAFLLSHPPQHPEQGALIVVALADALACAHAAGVVHRDVKPENVMLRAAGSLVLCDFGIAQVVDKERMTATGQLLGSPAYMAPEHIDGQPLDGRSDLFSLGVVLYELTCGVLPFQGRNLHELLKRIDDGVYRPPGEVQPQCGPRLARIIERALQREPAARYQDMGALRDDLRAYLRELGLTDPQAELRAYLLDPVGYAALLLPRLLRALLELGQRHRAERRTAAALSAWGRALSLAREGSPERAEAQALLRGVTQSERRRRQLRAGALVCGAAVAAAGLGLLTRPLWHGGGGAVDGGREGGARHGGPLVGLARDGGLRDGGSAGGARDGSATFMDMIRDGGLGDGALHDGGAKHGARPDAAPLVVSGAQRSLTPPEDPPPRRPPRKPPGPKVPLRTVVLSPYPKAVQISLNGRLLGDYSEVRTLELPPGPAEILFENPACYSERVQISASESPGELRVRLRWKPAQLRVVTRPPDADLVIDERIVGRGGQLLAVPIRSADGRASVGIQVSAPGHRTQTRAVPLRANQRTDLEVNLEPG